MNCWAQARRGKMNTLHPFHTDKRQRWLETLFEKPFIVNREKGEHK